MPQLHFYVPENVANALKQKAKSKALPVSKYLAELVKKEVGNEWPKGYQQAVFGQWQGDRLERGDQGEFESRKTL